MKKVWIALAIIIIVFGGAFLYLKFSPRFEKVEVEYPSLDDDLPDKAETSETPTGIELVKPAERDPQRWGNARCNDGTPFAFVFLKSPSGKSHDWVIYLQGGGMCNDLGKTNESNCQFRLKNTTSRTTTIVGQDGTNFKSYPAASEGVFNSDSKVNPAFHDANKVHAHYCSSDLWTGSTSGLHQASAGKWYFSGRLNIRAMMELLVRDYGLEDNQSTNILFVGTSAGGVGVDQNAETLVKMFPLAVKEKRLKLISDAGFAVEFNHPGYSNVDSDSGESKAGNWNYNFWGSSLNSLCEKDQIAQGQSAGRCILGKVLARYLTACDSLGLCLPRLVQLSSLDSWQLKQYGIDNSKDPADIRAGQAFKQQALEQLDSPYIPWLFSGGKKPYHTLSHKDEGLSFGPEGKTYGDVLLRFWQGGKPERVIF